MDPLAISHDLLLPHDGLREPDREAQERLAKLGQSLFRDCLDPYEVSHTIEGLARRQTWDNHILYSCLRDINAKLDRILLVHGKLP